MWWNVYTYKNVVEEGDLHDVLQTDNVEPRDERKCEHVKFVETTSDAIAMDEGACNNNLKETIRNRLSVVVIGEGEFRTMRRFTYAYSLYNIQGHTATSFSLCKARPVVSYNNNAKLHSDDVNNYE